MFKKFIPLIGVIFLSACAQPADFGNDSMSCQCCQGGQCPMPAKAMKMDRKKDGVMMKDGQMCCPMCLKAKGTIKPTAQ